MISKYNAIYSSNYINPKFKTDSCRSLCKTGKIHSYWTHDGSVLVKKKEQSRTINIKNRKDVHRLVGEIIEEDENNDV
jgi:hypothetical protein